MTSQKKEGWDLRIADGYGFGKDGIGLGAQQ